MKALNWLRPITLLVAVFLILLGCAADSKVVEKPSQASSPKVNVQAADRKVIGNTFQSSFPKMSIQIGPQFTYLRKQTWSGTVKAYQSDKSISEDREWYIFIPRGAKGRIDKVLYIYIATTQNYWVKIIPDDMKNLDYGIMKLNDASYQYYSRIEVPNTSNSLNKYIVDSGYSLPSCVLRRVFVAYPYKDIRIIISYFEDAASSGMSCKKKYSAQTLSDNERNYLSVLHQKALAAFDMREVPKVQIAKPEPEKPQKMVIKGEKVKIGIIEFQNINEEAKKDSLGLMFSEMLTTSFVNSEAFKITEREQLQKVAKELELSQSGIIDTSQAKQLGKMVGADAIITGSVTKIGSDLRLDARIIDVQSGVILTAEKIIGKTDLHSISNMADRIVDNLVNKFYRDKKP